MSVSLLFCSLTLQALQFTFFFRLYAKYIPYLLTTPLPLCYTSERRPQSHWTARLNDWATDSSLWLSLKLLNENISCHINEQEMSPPSVISGPQMWMRAPQIVIQGVLLLPHPRDCWGAGGAGSKVGEEMGLAPMAEVTGKEWRQWPEAAPPRYRMLDPLTWYLIFDVQTACSLCCKPVYSLTHPLPPWSSFLRATEMLSPGFEVLNIHTK